MRGVHYTDMLIYFDVIHLATCCHKNQLHNFAVRGYLAITFFRVFRNNEKMPIQYLAIFTAVKTMIFSLEQYMYVCMYVCSFQMKNLDIFLFLLIT